MPNPAARLIFSRKSCSENLRGIKQRLNLRDIDAEFLCTVFPTFFQFLTAAQNYSQDTYQGILVLSTAVGCSLPLPGNRVDS